MKWLREITSVNAGDFRLVMDKWAHGYIRGGKKKKKRVVGRRYERGGGF